MKFMNFYLTLTAVLIAVNLPSLAFGHAHTHVGVNEDGVWNTDDDNQLWIFASPSEPQWDTIELIPTGDYIGGQQIYAAELDCWHSAHPESGLYQLDFNDSSTQPDWAIELKRAGFSSENFWMEDEATGLEVLTTDGSTVSLGEPAWDDELSDGNGGTGAWHIHKHIEFLALADGAGETFNATFTVIDSGTTSYNESAEYTFSFVTVPEPATLALLGTGMFLTRFRRKGQK